MHPKSPIPRNGRILIVGIVARISGCANQKELSLDDQIDHAKETVADFYDGPVEYRIFSTKGKGEALDRPELQEIEAALKSGELDLLICEDLGRLVRGTAAKDFCGIAVDHGVRVIVPNDCIDTNDETWEEDVIGACKDHVSNNAHTSRRLKNKSKNRHRKFGGCVALPIAGIIKPVDGKTYDTWRVDPDAIPIIREGFRILRETLNAESVADYFNRVRFKDQAGFPTGPYCKRKLWNGRMVLLYYRNRLLSGRAGRGFKHTVKRHETGRRVSQPNPDGPIFFDCPQLVVISADEHDELIARLNERNATFRRKDGQAKGSNHRGPRKRTIFPGQAARCWYCGSQCVWGGNGITDHLMCNGSRQWCCWNSIGFSGKLATEAVITAIERELHQLDGIDEQLRQLLANANTGTESEVGQRWAKLVRDEQDLVARRANAKKALMTFGDDPIVAEALAEVQQLERQLRLERQTLDRLRTQKLTLPESVQDLRNAFHKKLVSLASDSFELGDLLRQIVPEFHVFLVRLCDGGHLLPRARVKIAFHALFGDAQYVAGVSKLLERVVHIDLFLAPQRERIREEAVRLADQCMEQREIARQIGEQPSQTAVYDALSLAQLMHEKGLTDPYIVVAEPPADYKKLRRHRNHKYAFRRVEGYQPPTV